MGSDPRDKKSNLSFGFPSLDSVPVIKESQIDGIVPDEARIDKSNNENVEYVQYRNSRYPNTTYFGTGKALFTRFWCLIFSCF